MEFAIKGDEIQLNQLLKVLDLVDTWWMAKNVILDWLVKVNGEVVTVIRLKLKKWDVVEFNEEEIEII